MGLAGHSIEFIHGVHQQQGRVNKIDFAVSFLGSKRTTSRLLWSHEHDLFVGVRFMMIVLHMMPSILCSLVGNFNAGYVAVSFSQPILLKLVCRSSQLSAISAPQ